MTRFPIWAGSTGGPVGVRSADRPHTNIGREIFVLQAFAFSRFHLISESLNVQSQERLKHLWIQICVAKTWVQMMLLSVIGLLLLLLAKPTLSSWGDSSSYHQVFQPCSAIIALFPISTFHRVACAIVESQWEVIVSTHACGTPWL